MHPGFRPSSPAPGSPKSSKELAIPPVLAPPERTKLTQIRAPKMRKLFLPGSLGARIQTVTLFHTDTKFPAKFFLSDEGGKPGLSHFNPAYAPEPQSRLLRVENKIEMNWQTFCCKVFFSAPPGSRLKSSASFQLINHLKKGRRYRYASVSGAGPDGTSPV